MSDPNAAISVTLRIPGDWSDPGPLLQRIPDGYTLTPENLILPDGTEIEFSPLPPDDQFPGIFRSSCRRPASREELTIVDRYTVNVALTGPGGSFDAALKTMEAGAAIIKAGGAGVFIDNSMLAHGGRDWIEMTEDGGSDALSFAFAAIIQARHEVYTIGMHVLGLPDILMSRSDIDEDGDQIIEIIRYMCHSDDPVKDGHLLADLQGPRFRAVATPIPDNGPPSPMDNPFGRLKMVSMSDEAAGN